MAYACVTITNSTNYIVEGTVEYASALCSNDKYMATPLTTWTAKSRGVCLLTKVTATVKTPSGDIVAKSYSSSGTSFSKFAVIQTGENTFTVTRVVS